MSDFPERPQESSNHPHTKSSCTPPRERRDSLAREATVERLVAGEGGNAPISPLTRV